MPNEACGLLLSIPHRDPDGRLTNVVEIPNRSLTPRTSYLMSKADLHLSMEDHPEQEVAAWHTHPGGFIGPSGRDMAARPSLDIPMLVVALTEDGPVPTWF